MDYEIIENEKVNCQYECKRVYPSVKRIIDIILSTMALIVILPIMILIIILIRLDSPGKAIYKHYRLGRKGKVIGVYKFRTMVDIG